MAEMRRFDLDDLTNRPGTYFHPELEVMIVVDDSLHVDNEIFAESDDGDWVLISDETPIDEQARDDLVETFQARHSPGSTSIAPEDDEGDDEDDLEPDPDPDEL